MSLNIKNHEACRLIEELAKETGETMTEEPSLSRYASGLNGSVGRADAVPWLKPSWLSAATALAELGRNIGLSITMPCFMTSTACRDDHRYVGVGRGSV